MAEDAEIITRVGVRRRVTLRVVLRSFQVLSWFAVYLAVLTLALGPFLWIWCRLFDHRRSLPRKLVRMFYRQGMRGFCGRNMRIVPFDWSAISGPCIMVANHQSVIDILLMMQLPPDARCWSKDWPFHRPLLGWLMALCGHLHVDDPDVMNQAMDGIRQGVSMYIFAEGTRSRTHRLGRFHDGAFQLACAAHVPVVPVVIHGSGDCMPPGQIAVFDVPIVVEPLGMLYADESLPHPHRELKRRAHAMIAAALENGPGGNKPIETGPVSTAGAAASARNMREVNVPQGITHG